MHAGIPPPPPGTDTPPEQTPPGPDTTTPPGADPPGVDPPWSRPPRPDTTTPPRPDTTTPPGSRHPPGPDPPQEADYSIRSTSGQYASYWNAFLFNVNVISRPNDKYLLSNFNIFFCDLCVTFDRKTFLFEKNSAYAKLLIWNLIKLLVLQQKSLHSIVTRISHGVIIVGKNAKVEICYAERSTDKVLVDKQYFCCGCFTGSVKYHTDLVTFTRCYSSYSSLILLKIF